MNPIHRSRTQKPPVSPEPPIRAAKPLRLAIEAVWTDPPSFDQRRYRHQGSLTEAQVLGRASRVGAPLGALRAISFVFASYPSVRATEGPGYSVRVIEKGAKA